jgi:hypothetical protein
MATPISIVISAINKSKAAFNEVVDQLDKTKNRIDKFSNAFKGIFVAGMFAGFVKGLVGATTETEKLQGSVAKIKDAFRPALQTVADGIVNIVVLMEKPIAAFARFINNVVEGVQYASAYTAALIESKSHSEAKAIAETTVAQMSAERNARAEAMATAEEREKLAKETADAEIKEAQRVAKEKEELQKELTKLDEELTRKKIKREEEAMTKEALLAKRIGELKDQEEQAALGRFNRNEKQRLTAMNAIEDLNAEILSIQKSISDEAANSAKNQQDAALKIINESLQNEKLETQKQLNSDIQTLEKQRELLLERQHQLIDEAAEKRRLAVQPGAVKELERQEKQREKEDKKFQDLLESAKKRMTIGGDLSRLTREQRFAIESEQASVAAKQAQQEADTKQAKIDELQIKMEQHLASIDQKIKDAVTFTR